MKFKPVPQDRQSLYDAVWSRPVREVAKDFGLSDRGLALLCKRHKIPVPPRGYWAKKQAGQKVKQPTLPKAKDDAVNIPEIDEQTRAEARIRREILNESNKAVTDVQLTPELSAPHPLVEAAAKTLRASRVDENGLLRARSPGRLAIRVTPQTLDRALRIMDSLIKALVAQGLTVGAGTDEEKPTAFVIVDEEQVEFEMTEETKAFERRLNKTQMLDKLKNPWKYSRPEYDHVPLGQLTITITNRRSCDGFRGRFSDGTTAWLDRNLHTVVAGLIAAGKKKHVDRMAREEQQCKWEEQHKQAEAERRSQEREERRWKLLQQDINKWRLAEEIRAYVSVRRERMSSAGVEFPNDSSLGKFLEWATDAADRLDPTRSMMPPRARRSCSWGQDPEDEW